MAKNNSLRGKSKEEITRHYAEALDGYKALLKKTPDYELKRFCEEAGISSHGMKSRMLYRGFRVQDLQSEAYNKDRLDVSAPSSGQFIQISPAAQASAPVPDTKENGESAPLPAARKEWPQTNHGAKHNPHAELVFWRVGIPSGKPASLAYRRYPGRLSERQRIGV